MSYDEINYLLYKYSTKQPQERWSKESERKKDNLLIMKEKIRLFEGINNEYFGLIGGQKERAKYLIKRLNFNNICPKCSNEQMIVLICYYVKCEYKTNYGRNYCRRVFKQYEISDNLIDRFMVYLARLSVKKCFREWEFLY